MTDIGFYHLTRSPLERVLPKLLGKAHATGARIIVMVGSPERVDVLDQVRQTIQAFSMFWSSYVEQLSKKQRDVRRLGANM